MPPPVLQVAGPPLRRPPDPAPAARRSSWRWLLLLAVLALGLTGGYVLTRDGGLLASPRLAALEAQVALLDPKLAAAQAEVESLRGSLAEAPSVAEVAALGRRLDEVLTALDSARAERDQLRADLEELARRPPEVADNRLSEQAVAAYQRELAAMRQMVGDELARIRAASEQATSEAVKAAQAGVSADSLALLAELGAALASGAGFADPLDRLAVLDPALKLDALRTHQAGVPPVTELQSAFADAARLALAADTQAQSGGGVGGFLRAQLGLRSLKPREGDSADAVLSRAEAALRDGDLSGALTQLDTLTGPALDAMADWRVAAAARVAAQVAYQELERAVRG